MKDKKINVNTPHRENREFNLFGIVVEEKMGFNKTKNRKIAKLGKEGPRSPCGAAGRVHQFQHRSPPIEKGQPLK